MAPEETVLAPEGSTQEPESAPDATSAGTEAAPATEEPTKGSWRDGLDTDMRNHQSLTKFKDVGDLAKSYVEVESMVGRKGVVLPDAKDPADKDRFYNEIGRPKTAEEYDLNGFEGPGGVEWNSDLQTSMMDVFHKAGLTQDQVPAVMNGYAEHINTLQQAATQQQEQSREQSMQSLREKFGNAYDARILNAQQAIQASAGDSAEGIVGLQLADGSLLGDHPGVIEMFANIGVKMSEHGLVGEKSPGLQTLDPAGAKQKLAELMSDEDYMKALNTRDHPGHGVAVKRRADLFNAMHPEEAA